ncbi:hypothetical protein H8B13_14395 [Hymenobacter sp. BT188]|uniref:hypothetical protein n=1 Tax=Hymenobacter sp. BT188 TaxID=2763504 RepID=UPI0016515A57|nr:hypothetical protein [Hymenobacter sp. BT188]MBC6608013.1 hypothetical protein [Hymenobacter sp. BT188]
MIKIQGTQEDSNALADYSTLLSEDICNILNCASPVSLIDDTYLNILKRIRANLFGIAIQLTSWPKFHELKLPIDLLFRTLLTDSLTLLYLATFDESEQSFNNELSLLDTGVISYIKTYLENYHLIDDDITEFNKEDFLNNLYKLVPHLRSDSDIKINRKPESIRHNSNSTLFKATTNQIPRGKLTEEAMFEQIKSHFGTAHLSYIYIYQRLFSQSHHFARFNKEYINWSQEHVCLNWFIALGGVYHTVDIISGMLGMHAISDQVKNNVSKMWGYVSD